MLQNFGEQDLEINDYNIKNDYVDKLDNTFDNCNNRYQKQ